jgi:putative PIN family toxin of toxin-antitoxin system
MKIVIDTNALISAAEDEYNFGNRIIDEVLAGKIQAFANSQTLRENKLIVSRKLADDQYAQKLSKYFEAVTPVEAVRIDAVEDREDNKILASAVAAGADFLITSDWHLLKMNEYQGVRIVTPQGFWSEYQTETGQGWQDWISNFLK